MLYTGDLSGLSNFELSNSSAYSRLIVDTMRSAYDFAKKGAADELKVPAPATKRETAALFSQNAQAVVQKQMSDLLFEIKSAVLSEVRKTGTADMSVPTVLNAASQSFDDFFKNQMMLGGTAAVAIAINRGRGDVFDGIHDQIAVYQYSAILDGKTCPICEALDGSTLDYAGYRASKWQPPIHFHCRCIWVAILKTQLQIPPVTGFPEKPGGVTEPSL